MIVPIRYILRSFVSRRLTVGMTVLGIALVVFVFSAVLMMAHGLRQTLRASGSDQNVMVLRKAANSETLSVLDRETATIITGLPLARLYYRRSFTRSLAEPTPRGTK